MKSFLWIVVALMLPAVGSLAQLAEGGPADPAIVPQERIAEGWWGDRHQQVLEEVKDHPDTQLLLIGDSITNNYDKSKLPDENFQPTWQTFYAPRKALNLGFSGDTTANVLWRLAHGEVDGLHPKVAIVLIGTNNTGWRNQTAAQTEVGIDAVVADLELRLPQTHILLMGITPSDITEKKTEEDLAVNQYLATCYGESKRVTYLDIGSIFYRDGKLNTAIFYDPRLPQLGKALHPDTNGQRMMADQGERLRPAGQNQVWAMDLVADRLSDGRRIRSLTIVDTFTRESVAIEVGQSPSHKSYSQSDEWRRSGYPY